MGFTLQIKALKGDYIRLVFSPAGSCMPDDCGDHRRHPEIPEPAEELRGERKRRRKGWEEIPYLASHRAQGVVRGGYSEDQDTR